jgi:CubicO group peptidase (beta-lactamase class C family)
MKFLKWLGYIILGIVIAVNALILITGRYYLYKGIANTYLKGRSGPSIDEYGIFANRLVKAGTPQPWAIAKDYNKKSIPGEYLKQIEGYQTEAYVIIKNDSLCYEQYWDGYSDTSHTNSFSMAKSIVSILTGIALQEGKIKSIDEHVSDFIPAFKNGMDSLLTIKDLLTMSSGMSYEESYSNPFDYPAEAYYGDDIIANTLKYKVVTEPGKKFIYQSGNSALLGYIITLATGEKLSDYASEKLWQPLGAEQPAYWSLDHKEGMEKAYCCFNSNARDFARFGQLYLDSGKWNGKQIVPQNYVIASTHPALSEHYGYNWWILTCNGYSIPYCRGILGQYIFVIPGRNMVVVRLGKRRGPVNDNVPSDALIYIKAALDMYPTTKNNN